MSSRVESLPNSQNIVREVLPNGIVVLVYENFTVQSVVLTGSLAVGSVFEPADKNGLASMVAAALMRGSAAYDFNTINESLESVAADVGFGGSTFTTSFSGKSLGEDLPLVLDILADVVRRPTFPEGEIERLRGEIVTGLNYRMQDTRFRAGRAFYETLYPPEHPYHGSSRGTPASVAGITVADLHAFHQQHYGPQEMVIVIVGAVKADQAIQWVKERLGDWSNSNQPARPRPDDTIQLTKTTRINVGIPGKTQTDIVLGGIGPSRLSKDFHAAQLANSVLGQFGMMGRIGGKVREELGLAYYAYSQVEGGITPLPWNVAAGVDPENVDLAIDRMIDEIRRLTVEIISEEELTDNQSYFTGRLPLQLETNEGIASMIRNIETYGLGLDYLLSYREMIRDLSRSDLLAAAKRYLNPDALVIAVAGPPIAE